MQKIIKWFLGLFKKEIETAKPTTTDKFPFAKGYTIHTREGGTLHCASQRDVAETLAALYNMPIKRDHVHHALQRYKGRLAYKGEYIATINYRKEISK